MSPPRSCPKRLPAAGLPRSRWALLPAEPGRDRDRDRYQWRYWCSLPSALRSEESPRSHPMEPSGRGGGGVPGAVAPGLGGGAVAVGRSGQSWEGDEAVALIGIETLEALAAHRRPGSVTNADRVVGVASYASCSSAPWPVLYSVVTAWRSRAGPASGSLSAAAVLEHGVQTLGLPASPGVGVGVRRHFKLETRLGHREPSSRPPSLSPASPN